MVPVRPPSCDLRKHFALSVCRGGAGVSSDGKVTDYSSFHYSYGHLLNDAFHRCLLRNKADSEVHDFCHNFFDLLLHLLRGTK